jgi:hypothetical protein
MSRLAKSSNADYRRARCLAPGAERRTFVSAAGLASANLMPDGCGLTIARLDTVPIEQQLREGEQAAARLAHSFLEADIADASDWVAANRNPFAFLKYVLERWLAAHGGPVIREQFSLDVLLSTSLERYLAGESKSGEISKVFIAVEPVAPSDRYLAIAPKFGNPRLFELHPLGGAQTASRLDPWHLASKAAASQWSMLDWS